MQPQTFAWDFLRRLQDGYDPTDLPAYDTRNVMEERALLLSSSLPQEVQLGTGASIFTNSILPAILSAQHEVLFVTCFWAKSKTLTALRETLELLASRRKEHGDAQPLRISICFSSSGFFQKLFHTSSKDGYIYPSSAWKKLGLPDDQLLRSAGISLTVKTIFFRPFSIMHPKFVIVDRHRAFLPSCNVSWEPWLEGCVRFTGEAIEGLLAFYQRVWDQQLDVEKSFPKLGGRDASDSMGTRVINSPATVKAPFQGDKPIFTMVLPSSHHCNPRFRPFPWQAAAPPPVTPLNAALLELLGSAQRHIYVHTPNLTARCVLDALLSALGRGVDVHIVTSPDTMVLEQLVTAGTTTSLCLRWLAKRYRALATLSRRSHAEDGLQPTGELLIEYFRPMAGIQATPGDESAVDASEEPVQNHLKLTMVDGQYTILGSGNMDRPSLHTSQELGILFHSAEFATLTKRAVEEVLVGRTDVYFPTEADR